MSAPIETKTRAKTATTTDTVATRVVCAMPDCGDLDAPHTCSMCGGRVCEEHVLDLSEEGEPEELVCKPCVDTWANII